MRPFITEIAGYGEEAKGAKKPSAYNIFMKDELAKIKKAEPSIEHK